jgi:hypothetical protein
MDKLAHQSITDSVHSALDGYQEQLTINPSVATVDQLIRELNQFYDQAVHNDWLQEFREACQDHPLHERALQDPFTERAFKKPRGYAGDAVMLDFIYRPRDLQLSAFGSAFNTNTTGVSAAKSIVWRRDHLGEQIIRTVEGVRNARILSVASGHLRELDLVRSATAPRDFTIVALDQDPESLIEAVNQNQDFNIVPEHKSISHLFRGQDTTKYDLIYSAGLFDYLPTKTASGLIDQLVRMLSASGRIIIGNYAPENYGRGYMEGMMGWTLLYRSEKEMEDLLTTKNARRIYRDDPGNVVYMEILSG